MAQNLYNSTDSAKQFKILSADYKNYTGIQLKANVKTALEWDDAQGKNLLLMMERNRNTDKQKSCKGKCYDAELYAHHYLVKNKMAKMVRQIFDFIDRCEFDLYAEFIKNSLTITDLNKNGYAEITFLYRKTCTSDVSPMELKLMLIENNKKFALRGYTTLQHVLDMAKEEREKEIKTVGWGTYKIDSAFDQAPKVFLQYAKKQWEKHYILSYD